MVSNIQERHRRIDAPHRLYILYIVIMLSLE